MREKVLIVDDEPGVRALLWEVLKASGYDVITAGRGSEALEAIGLEAPDLVITDIGMPDMTGIELAREIRSHHFDMPILIMTGNPEVATTVEAMELGIHDYLWKPLDIQEFGLAVDRALAVRQLRRELSAFYLELDRFETLRDGLEEVLTRGLDRPGFQVARELGPLCLQIADRLGAMPGEAGTALQARFERLMETVRRFRGVAEAERRLPLNDVQTCAAAS